MAVLVLYIHFSFATRVGGKKKGDICICTSQKNERFLIVLLGFVGDAVFVGPRTQDDDKLRYVVAYINVLNFSLTNVWSMGDR